MPRATLTPALALLESVAANWLSISSIIAARRRCRSAVHSVSKNVSTICFARPGADQRRPQRQHIGVVVLAAVACGRQVVTQGGPHAGELVGRHGRADPRAIHDHPDLGPPVGHPLSHFRGNLRIVDRLGAVRTAVFDGETTRTDVFGKLLLELKSAVVSANCYGLHQEGEDEPAGKEIARATASIVNRANWAVKRAGDVSRDAIEG